MASYLKLQCLLLSYCGGRILRPLKVGIHRSAVATDVFHAKSIIEQQS